MDVSLVDNHSFWFYDPEIYGVDDDIFQVISGSATLAGGKIRIQGTTSLTTMVMGGQTILRLRIPAAPAGGHDRVWGYYSRAKGNKDAAYFYISGTNFYARTYDPNGVVEQTTIPWRPEWTNADVNWEIRFAVNKTEFYWNWTDQHVGNGQGISGILARHDTSIPKRQLLPIYFSNNQADNFDLSYIEVANALKMYFAKPFTGELTTSTSTTTTTTSSSTTTTSSSTTTTSSSTSSSTTVTSSGASGPTLPSLGVADDFVVLSKTGVTNTGSHTSSIVGNVGSSPITAAAMNGLFCSEVTGTIYGVDAAYVGSGDQSCFLGNPPLANKTFVDNAVLAMETAYNDAAALTGPNFVELGAGDISGMTLVPGLYKWSTDVVAFSDVTLSGGASDTWLFQIAGNLTLAAAGSLASGVHIVLSGGAVADNVMWQVGGGVAVTLGTYSTMVGNILSAKQIIMQTGVVLNGAALAQTQVTLDAVTISPPGLTTTTSTTTTTSSSTSSTTTHSTSSSTTTTTTSSSTTTTTTTTTSSSTSSTTTTT